MKTQPFTPVLSVTADDASTTGNRYGISFRSVDRMKQAARHLLECHPHHFDVRPDDHHSLKGLTLGAVECLHRAGIVGDGALRTVQESHNAHLARVLEG